MHEDMLKYLGRYIHDARTRCGLTQQELAEQTGRGYRNIQKIEKGEVNPSYEVLASLIKRLGISPNSLFYPDSDSLEQNIQQFLGNFLACTEDERQIILNTLNCMAQQFIIRHQQIPFTKDSE